ncbi:hypothetical protein VNO78_17899 [Psophocarpus tetragonolobus]|uniref:Uncharacterized protein n=1 Tax=Psophocarpus tetragonolobus TaxID=3891 RepID=A0AAN9SIV4_PSOTE
MDRGAISREGVFEHEWVVKGSANQQLGLGSTNDNGCDSSMERGVFSRESMAEDTMVETSPVPMPQAVLAYVCCLYAGEIGQTHEGLAMTVRTNEDCAVVALQEKSLIYEGCIRKDYPKETMLVEPADGMVKVGEGGWEGEGFVGTNLVDVMVQYAQESRPKAGKPGAKRGRLRKVAKGGLGGDDCGYENKMGDIKNREARERICRAEVNQEVQILNCWFDNPKFKPFVENEWNNMKVQGRRGMF